MSLETRLRQGRRAAHLDPTSPQTNFFGRRCELRVNLGFKLQKVARAHSQSGAQSGGPEGDGEELILVTYWANK